MDFTLWSEKEVAVNKIGGGTRVLGVMIAIVRVLLVKRECGENLSIENDKVLDSIE